MAAALDQRHAPPAPGERRAPSASRRSRSRRRPRRRRYDRSVERSWHLPKPHAAHASGRSDRCSRFIRWSRARRASRHARAGGEALEIPEIDEDPAAMPDAGERRARSCARCLQSWRSKGALPQPGPPARRFPIGVGMSDTTRGAAGERDVDRPQQPVVLLVGAGQTAAKSAERREATLRARCSAYAARARNHRPSSACSSASSASGCTVSRPMATSSWSPLLRHRRRSASRNRSTRAANERWMRFDDHARQAVEFRAPRRRSRPPGPREDRRSSRRCRA